MKILKKSTQPNAKTKSVQDEILSSNQWYTQEQLPNISNPSQKRTIARRWKFFKRIISNLAYSNQHLTILDAGCGDGINQTLLSKIPNATIYGCDYNPLRIERAKAAFPQTDFFEQDLTQPITWGRDFDIIICSQVLEHIKQDDKAIETLKNVLSKEGVLILGVPNEGCLFARLRNHIFEPEIAKTTDHVNFYTKPIIKNKIEAAELKIFRIFYENFFFPTQGLLSLFVRNALGFKIINLLNKILPSQSAGFYFAIKRNE